MFSYCTNYLATMPDITVYVNCDTRLAINLSLFDLGEYDEFIFAIKNYNYIDSPCVFMFKARKSDIDEETGEVIFKITPEVSKNIKPGAFYNFAVLIDAYNPRKETEYKKLTENGNIQIEYGAHDLVVEPENKPLVGSGFIVTDVRLVSPDTIVDSDINTDIGVSLEAIN